MAERPGVQPDPGTAVGATDHDVAVAKAAKAVGLPPSALEEAIGEARAVGRHRIRAVPAQRIDELISELADAKRTSRSR